MAGENLNLNVEKYKKRALEEIAQLEKLLKIDALYLCFSRCYYAAFYSMKAALAERGVQTSSHKQTQVEFRKRFVKTGEIDKKYSKILAELFETRSKADYDIHWATNKHFVERIIKETKNSLEKF